MAHMIKSQYVTDSWQSKLVC